MSLLLTKVSLERSPWLLDEAVRVLRQDSTFMRSSYPHFESWLSSKVLPGLCTGERTVVIEQRGGEAVGLLIVKHTNVERKLCTLRVRPNFESRGLGIRLFQTAFELLGTDRPLLSVSSPTMPKFERLFEYFGFAQAAVYRGRYIPMVDEVSYNGELDGQYTRWRPTAPDVAKSCGPSCSVPLLKPCRPVAAALS